MAAVGTLRGLSANVLRRLLFRCAAGFFLCLAVACVTAWLLFHGTATGYTPVSVAFAIAMVGVMLSALALDDAH